MKKILALFCITLAILNLKAQEFDSTSVLILDYENPKRYEIGGIAVHGNNFTDGNVMVLMSGLGVGQTITIPGDELKMATERLWDQNLFSDVEIRLAGQKEGAIYLNIVVSERPRLSKFSIQGLSKSQTNDIRDEIKLQKNQLITEDLINKTRKKIAAYFHEKGYYDVNTEFQRNIDPEKPNYEVLRIKIDRGKKIKLQDIVFDGNKSISEKKLRKLIKPKRKYRKINIFASSKFVEETYEETKPSIISEYNSNGFRDARIVYDSVIPIHDARVLIKIKIEEGTKYYFRDIRWVGNSRYSTSLLDTVLGIKKGDVYDQGKLETKLYMNPTGFDISSLYMDDGYLFFNVNPVEVLVEGDSIDLELRVFEGKQATVNRVTVTGNDKTSDFVVLRALRTRPGDKFSRSDIQRSMRELAALGFFDPEGLDVNPIPNPANGTVDIEYKVVEKSSDQIEASGGWGGWGGFVGTLGLTLNNFSTRKMFEPGGWAPIPSGDGQQLAIRAQSNGQFYQGYNFSFTEPWLGGKRPNSFSFNLFHSVQYSGFRPNRSEFKTTGGTIAYGMMLKKPDDFFSLNFAMTYQRYTLKDWRLNGADELGFNNGFANNLSFITTFGRNSTNHPIYPTDGSMFSSSLQLTPPYSLFKKDVDYRTVSAQERFKWIELHKWKFSGQWFLGFPDNAKRKFVIAPAIRFGAIGIYNNDIGYSPFELFRVGGSGLTGFVLYGTDIISQRGYDEGSISDPINGQNALPFFTKYTLEIRYPLTVGQSSTIFAQTFLEAGNAWSSWQEYDPYQLRRAVGVGVRLFLPMFGLLGVDYAWGFDQITPGTQGQFHFFIGQQF